MKIFEANSTLPTLISKIHFSRKMGLISMKLCLFFWLSMVIPFFCPNSCPEPVVLLNETACLGLCVSKHLFPSLLSVPLVLPWLFSNSSTAI